MKAHTALEKSIKNDTCIEFRRDVKALTLLADITSGNLFDSLYNENREKNLTNSDPGIRIIHHIISHVSSL